ncbi:hypothetical protein QN239_20605 [Mycolicibacterium sp. Y3]
MGRLVSVAPDVAGVVEAADVADVAGDDVADEELVSSARATTGPAASAAPTPNVTAPAPSQAKGSRRPPDR